LISTRAADAPQAMAAELSLAAIDDIVLLNAFHIKGKRCRVYLHRGVLIWETERRPFSEFIDKKLHIYFLFGFQTCHLTKTF
jgi:hypothetical protein